METNPATQSKSNKTVIGLLVVIILLLCAVLAVFLMRGNGPAQSADGTKLTYANAGVVALGDEESLQAAVDQAMKNAEEGKIALNYKNIAVSEDGKVFSCQLGNSVDNAYDMFISIYGDLALTDQLFLSGLIRPGEAFDSIELTRALDPGTHTVYCAFTQVADDHATIRGQLVVALQLKVSK